MPLQDILVDATVAEVIGAHLCGDCDCWRLRLPTICAAIWHSRYADWACTQEALLRILQYSGDDDLLRTPTSLHGTLVRGPADVRLDRILARGAFGAVYLAASMNAGDGQPAQPFENLTDKRTGSALNFRK